MSGWKFVNLILPFCETGMLTREEQGQIERLSASVYLGSVLESHNFRGRKTHAVEGGGGFLPRNLPCVLHGGGDHLSHSCPLPAAGSCKQSPVSACAYPAPSNLCSHFLFKFLFYSHVFFGHLNFFFGESSV
jgi:hypothetical protein